MCRLLRPRCVPVKEEQELHREMEKGSVHAHNRSEYFSQSQLGRLFGNLDSCGYDNATKGFITGTQHGISAANASGCGANILQLNFIM